jgi:hypothetical protein
MNPRLFFLGLVLLAIPIFAHGCHRGDHDNEPFFVPLKSHVIQAEPPE